MFNINHNITKYAFRILVVLLGAFMAWMILSSCNSSKKATTEDKTKTTVEKSKDSVSVHKSLIEDYQRLKTLDSLRSTVKTTTPVAIKVNGKDTLVYILKDSTVTSYNLHDSTVIVRKIYYDTTHIFDTTIVKINKDVLTQQESKKSTGGWPFWMIIGAFIVGIFIRPIFSFIRNTFLPKLKS